MTFTIHRVKVKDLLAFAQEVLQKAGLEFEDASITADVLVAADVCGISSHGTGLLPTYVRRLQQGGIRAEAKPKEVWRKAGQLLVDACGAMGPVTAVQAVHEVLTSAKRYGAGLVMVKNSNHIGMLGYYSRMIAEQGLIGIVLTNSGPNVAAWGGAEPVLGNNALSVSVPGRDEPLFLLDIATGEVACGRVRLAAQSGEKEIPEGWILDAEGRPSTDPQDFINGGVVLPFGKHKGFGIGMLVDLLTGVMSGGLFASKVRRQRADYAKIAGSSHTFIAYDVTQYMSLETFIERVEEWIQIIKCTKKADGFDEILIPGEREMRIKRIRESEGVPFEEKQLVPLIQIAEELEIEHPFS